MQTRSQHAIIVAVVAVGIAALAGIAAIEGWVTLPGAQPPAAEPAETPRPRIAASPAESLLPGESIVEAPPPAAVAPAVKAPPAVKAKRSCPNCGEIVSTAYRRLDSRGAWEVRVRFDDGTRATLRYPTDPGYRVGDRVVMANGRLRKE